MENGQNDKKIAKFLALSTWEELFAFVDYYQEIKQVPKQFRIRKKDLGYILFSKKSKYHTYHLSKKGSGKTRLIEAPTRKLKDLQSIINDCLQLCFTPKSAAHGFIRERSIVTNAREHVGRKYVYNVDLEDFFPSIHFGRIRGVFQRKPFNFSPEMAKLLANICCNEGRLPQGAPTSPVLSNLICRGLDGKLSQIAKAYKAKYTRYADDITFSCNDNIFNDDFFQRLNRAIESEGFKTNQQKERLQTWLERQMVTGLVVNKKLNTSPTYNKKLRFLISLWKKYGKDEAQKWLERNYDKRHRYNGKVPDIEQVISGKLEFFKMVSGERETYQSLEFRYNCAKAGLNLSSKDIKEAEEKTEKLTKALQDSPINKAGSTLIDLKEQLDLLEKSFPKSKAYMRGENAFQTFLKRKDIPFGTDKYKAKPPVNPFEQILPSIFESVNPRDSGEDEYKKEGSAQHQAMFMSLFRDTSHPFGKLLHRNNTGFKKLIEEGNLASKEIGKEHAKGALKKRIRPELYAAVLNFLSVLEYGNKELADKSYKDAFEKIEPIITSFKKMIRFGSSSDELKISELLLHQMQQTPGFFDRYRLLSRPESIDSNFQDVFSSVKNISEAFSIIFSGFLKHSKGVGAVKITVKKWNNRIVLRIIDCKSESKKTSEELMRGASGGDLQRLISLLAGYCDLNIRAVFPQGQFQKISLLPSPVQTGLSENYSPEGFTYELIFYRPIKVLLLDDVEEPNRLGIAKKLKEENAEYSKILDTITALEDINLLDYNAVFIHTSAKDYSKVREHAVKEKMPIVQFSGGKSFHQESKNDITMSDDAFYATLEAFCQEVWESGKFSLNPFIEACSDSENRKRGKNGDSKQEILDDIAKESMDCSKLPDEIINRIKKLVPEGVEIPLFRDRKSIDRFLTKHTQS